MEGLARLFNSVPAPPPRASLRGPPPRTGEELGWRAHLIALGVAVAAILLLFRRDAADMAAIWWNSSTFSHCLLIPPIIAWLVWQRLPELRRLEPAAWAPGLLVVASGALGWRLGEAGGVDLVRHAGLMVMVQGAVIACLGKAVTRGLAFPLFYACSWCRRARSWCRRCRR